MDHLDRSHITADKRPVTQTIAADLHDRRGAAGIRSPHGRPSGSISDDYERPPAPVGPCEVPGFALVAVAG